MKLNKMFSVIIIGLTIGASLADAARQVTVHGYHRKNGTFVQPYHRTAPNRTKFDNWSSKGNTNPYTGKRGNKSPFKNN